MHGEIFPVAIAQPCPQCGNVFHVYVEEDIEAARLLCPKCGGVLPRLPAPEIKEQQTETGVATDLSQASMLPNVAGPSGLLANALRRIRGAKRRDLLAILAGLFVGLLLLLYDPRRPQEGLIIAAFGVSTIVVALGYIVWLSRHESTQFFGRHIFDLFAGIAIALMAACVICILFGSLSFASRLLYRSWW
jgi:hypothetical protein